VSYGGGIIVLAEFLDLWPPTVGGLGGLVSRLTAAQGPAAKEMGQLRFVTEVRKGVSIYEGHPHGRR
jgi:hypothetical protein